MQLHKVSTFTIGCLQVALQLEGRMERSINTLVSEELLADTLDMYRDELDVALDCGDSSRATQLMYKIVEVCHAIDRLRSDPDVGKEARHRRREQLRKLK